MQADVVSAIKGEDSSPVGQVLASIAKNQVFGKANQKGSH